MSKPQLKYDVVIIGGGTVGASFACALGGSALRCCVVESVQLANQKESSYDDRGITLSQSSKNILTNLSIWDRLSTNVCPIKQIHVTDQGQFGVVRLKAEDVGLNELGYVVTARDLGAAIYEQLKSFDNIDLICPAKLNHFEIKNNSVTVQIKQAGEVREIEADLLVAADGSDSDIRKTLDIETKYEDYQQTAIVANVTTQKSNFNVAFERFTQHGPIALLPKASHQSVLVFTVRANEAEEYKNMSDAEFICCVEAEFGRRLGKLKKLGQRSTYPIMYIEAREQYKQNLVLLGNAAHSIHPNAAQGFNLGLRDAVGLAEILIDGFVQDGDISDIELLIHYSQQRHPDQKRIIGFTRQLATLFYTSFLPKRLLRNKLMLMLEHNPVARERLIHLLTGLWGPQPELARTNPLL